MQVRGHLLIHDPHTLGGDLHPDVFEEYLREHVVEHNIPLTLLFPELLDRHLNAHGLDDPWALQLVAPIRP